MADIGDVGTCSYYPRSVLKFCPRCSSDKFIFQDRKCFLCEECGFRFFINAAAAVVALIEDSQGRLLLVRRAGEPRKGTLDLPGGFVDTGETAEQALRREIQEELNLRIDRSTYFCSFPNTYLYAGIVYFTLDLAFVCTVKDISLIKAGDDADGYLFLAPGAIRIEDIGFDSIREITARFVASRVKDRYP